ncbi:acyl-CoA carboxylase epsilon subunit [Actinomycetes bacterium KLBMP 9759]
MAGEEPTAEERRALFHVVRGTPSDEELAAVTVVLAAAVSGGDDAPDTPQRDRWSDPAAALRTALSPGRDAWRGTYWPR